MNKMIALAGVAAVFAVAYFYSDARPGAQVQRPVLSPRDSAAGTVDGAALSITYGRPSMRGRKIFGSLVPFDRVWCPGADECTTLTSDRDLQFGGLRLKAGEYSLWMVPAASAWALIFNDEPRAFHTRHNPGRDVGKIVMQKQMLSTPVEQLTFTIEPNKSASGGVVAMEWETTRVTAAFTVAR